MSEERAEICDQMSPMTSVVGLPGTCGHAVELEVEERLERGGRQADGPVVFAGSVRSPPVAPDQLEGEAGSRLVEQGVVDGLIPPREGIITKGTGK